jgi:hypothetical protein
MGNPDTLRDFVRFGLNHYPAEKVGLIMWDHGGGSIAGFGHDEKFDDASLTLLDMDWAFAEAGLRERKLEFLGFDACLMATVEMAVLAAPYARVFIASEDLEPGDGWDYIFLGALNERPEMDGFELGRVIVDTFMDFYGPDSDEILSLSVVDLARVEPVMGAMGRLMALGSESLGHSRSLPGFRCLATRRAATKTFGEGSPRDNYSDMVDIGDMALQLADLFPREAEAVLRALAGCVTYNRHNADVELHGLSTYYVYGGKSVGEASLRTYAALAMDTDYTRYLFDFFDGLVRSRRPNRNTRGYAYDEADIVRREWVLWETVTEDVYRMAGLAEGEYGDFLWPHMNGQPISLFPVAFTARGRQYAIPAMVNERDSDIVVAFSEHSPMGRVMGVRHREGNVVQKGFDPIEPGDTVSLFSLEWDALTNDIRWHKGRAFTVRGALNLEWGAAPDGFWVGERLTDCHHEITYTTSVLLGQKLPYTVPAHQRSAFSNAS